MQKTLLNGLTTIFNCVFNMTQWRVLCPHNHLLKTAATAGDIRELSSPRVDQSTSCLVR